MGRLMVLYVDDGIRGDEIARKFGLRAVPGVNLVGLYATPTSHCECPPPPMGPRGRSRPYLVGQKHGWIICPDCRRALPDQYQNRLVNKILPEGKTTLLSISFADRQDLPYPGAPVDQLFRHYEKPDMTMSDIKAQRRRARRARRNR